MKVTQKSGIVQVEDWFLRQSWTAAPFQKELWEAYSQGNDGLLVAPTGSGKTYAIWGAVAAEALAKETLKEFKTGTLKALWLTPLRALSGDIGAAIMRMNEGVGLEWETSVRTGDTSSSVKAKQRKKLPEVLVTTPESLHVMLSYPESAKLFRDLQIVVADEWHDLLGTKRGVMVELALAHLRSIAPGMRTWGVSATLGNLAQAREVLLGVGAIRPAVTIHDTRPKLIEVNVVIPSEMERFPWAGHLGDRMKGEVLDIIRGGGSTLVFTNTRNQAELWYQRLLATEPELAGRIALHHGSLAQGERLWVEQALHDGRLAAVISTSSLDLGVDFRPVDRVIQIGGPKGVARFLQRAGRAGHRPGETSTIYFIPTNALELLEGAALKTSVEERLVEDKPPLELSYDVMVQWAVTLGVGEGFAPDELLKELRSTFAFRNMSDEVWAWTLQFVTSGGAALGHYDQYRKLLPQDDGRLKAMDRPVITRHRLGIGAITQAASLKVQVVRGRVLGSLEESFAGNLKVGQSFWFAGRCLDFVRMREMTVWVKNSTKRTGPTPSWAGGRLPLSSQLAVQLRHKLGIALSSPDAELQALAPILELQQNWSAVPSSNQLLVEQLQTREGHHLFVYPFEGRATHEVLALLLATRLARDPNTFSIAMNDYGFELLAPKSYDFHAERLKELFSIANLTQDLDQALAEGTAARRQFRTIAAISGLTTPGYPGKPQSNRHLQASSEMIYDVLERYDPRNQLLAQARDEVLAQVVDLPRLTKTLERLSATDIILTSPPRVTPLAFPIMVDRLREQLTTEKLSDRIERMQSELEAYATRTA